MRTLLTITATMLVVATLSVAADKPNFSGDWTLDATRSEFGPMPPPSSMTRKIDHTGANITVTTVTEGGPQGDQTTTAKYATDGTETTNQIMGTDAKSKATWKDAALVIDTQADFQGTAVGLTDTWTLSDDGKTMKDIMHIASPQGEFDITYVMNKK